MSRIHSRRFQALIAVAAATLVVVSLLRFGQTTPDVPAAGLRAPAVKPNDHHDTSPPLRVLPPSGGGDREEREEGVLPKPATVAGAVDTVVQSTLPTLQIPSTATNFDGIGNGFAGPGGTFSVQWAPPDTSGDIGPNHYVQIVNTDFAVFTRTGTPVYGPVPVNTLWSGFGGLCQTDNDGDGTVRYDQLANRWVITQFAVTGANGSTKPYLQCVAISQTGDPTGAYYRYSFTYVSFPDYPKLGIWPDAYYETFNLFDPNVFLGSLVCAYDRTRMLAGQAATQQCFSTTTTYGGLLPSDLDGQTLPPAGAPNYVVALGAFNTGLASWKFHVDWTTPATSTFSGPTTLPTSAYTLPCSGGGACVTQTGTTNKLDSLGDRLMYRLAYRNFGDHQSLVVNHSVTSGSSVGIRWYELRVGGGNLSVFQQGTYAPDTSYRWMGSIAQDHSGNMGLGFSASSSTTHPGIRYTGRLAGDALGQMTQGEGTIITGAGSQTGTLHRWGDYSAMAIDPLDDCTFWYTTEYIPADGTFNWKTRIASFQLPGCGAVANDFSIAASPNVLTLVQGASGGSTISTAVTFGSAATVGLSVSGAPAGVSASLSPTSVAAGGTSTLTVVVGTATTPGTYPLTVTGVEGAATHATTVTLTVTGPVTTAIVNGGFETGTLAGWKAGKTASVVSGGHGGVFAAQVGGTTATSGDSSLSQTFTVPAGATTLSFWYQVHCPDTVAHDYAKVTLKDNVTRVTATILAKTCTNNGTWVPQTWGVSAQAGHSVTLKLISHDDGVAADPTFTLYDDVTVE